MKYGESLCFSVDVQFEDVDSGGGVHYPNYLKYFERARNHHIKEAGFSTKKLMEQGFALVVAENYIKYVKPVVLEQELKIVTKITGVKKVGLRVEQAIFDKNQDIDLFNLPEKIATTPGILTYSKTKLVCADLKKLRPAPFPEELAMALNLPKDSLPEEHQNIDII